MSIYYCHFCNETKDRDADGCEEVEGLNVCTPCYERTIQRLLENHGIEDNDYTLEEAKAITGVDRIIIS